MRTLKISMISIILIFSFSYTVYPQTQYRYPATEKYRFRHLTSNDGLPSNWCWEVMKDSQGFIWITTRAGLCRYDGYNVKVFQHDPADSTSLSDNRISKTGCMVEDKDGNIWIGTLNGLNRYDPSIGKFDRFKHIPSHPGSISSSRITCLLEDKKGTLWIGTTAIESLNRYDAVNNSFKSFLPELDDSSSGTPQIVSLLEDRLERLWVGTNKGLFLFNRVYERFEQIHVDHDYPDLRNLPYCKTIHEDKDGTIVVGTRQGLILFDTTTNCLKPYPSLFHANLHMTNTDFLPGNFDNRYTHWVIMVVGIYGFNKQTSYIARIRPDPLDPHSISGNSLKSMFRDETGMLWVPGEFGVNIMDPIRQKIMNYPGKPEVGTEPTCFYEDRQGHMWKATYHLEKFDEKMNLIKSYPYIIQNPGEISITGAIFSILEDHDMNIWAGNDKNGLYLLEKGADAFKSCTFSEPGVSYIWDILEDSSGTLWIGTNSGLFYRKKGDTPFTHFYNEADWDLLNRSAILDITQDRYGNLWIGTAGKGLFYQPSDSSGTNYFFQLLNDPDQKYSLSNNWIWSVHEDNSGNLWVATEYGLNKRLGDENKFINYLSTAHPGVNFIYDLTDDGSGSLWLTTDYGLIQFTPDTGRLVTPATGRYRQILPFHDIFPYRIYQNRAGFIFIGGQFNSDKGYYRFHPDSIPENRNIPPVVLTDFKVHNKSYLLDTSITLKEHIVLNFNQNFITIECAALDYLYPEKNQYAHYLEGLEKDWIYTGNDRLTNYTDIPPGKYIFHAKGSNNDGIWNEIGISLAITILPPPWKTWWAYTIYGLVLGLMVYGLRRYDLKRQRLKQKLEIEHVEAEKLKELDSMKSRFFANISHEFRTPLTLILGPLEKLRLKISDKESTKDLNMMQRNALRLQNLINQLLSLSKLESGQMKLKARECNAIPLINGYMQSFESLAKQKGVQLVFKAKKDGVVLWIDYDKLEKILYNLLSNAFKYTDEGGRIVVEVDSRQLTVDSLVISVSDTGAGISNEILPHIFNRFYQADDSYSKDGKSSGIGLALTKELVELHHGWIEVESKEGDGTMFRVFLPLGKEHLKPEEMVTSYEPGEIKGPLIPLTGFDELRSIKAEDEKTEKEKPQLLVVEDNDDLRSHIRSYLTNKYRIAEAVDGEKGMEKAIESIPDLVISDVMMPKMDGIELCKRLKTDDRTSHIPVILLTARATIEDKLAGLETGADDYITKPFDARELLTRIKNLLELRQALRERFLKDAERIGLSALIDLPEAGISSMEQKFLQKAIGIINKNLSDPEFTVKRFCADMAMSNMQLHRKLVAVTGQTANRLIRSYRLNHAAKLLEKKAGNVTEVAFEVGFNNLSWFSKCFQEQFGMPPSEYPSKQESL